MLFALAQCFLGKQAFQFTHRADRHLLQDHFRKGAIVQRRPSDQLDQADRLAGMAPERGPEITFRAQRLRHRVAREALTDAGREATALVADDVTTGGVLHGMGDVVLELSIAPNGQRTGMQAIPIEASDAHAEHVQPFSQVAR